MNFEKTRHRAEQSLSSEGYTIVEYNGVSNPIKLKCPNNHSIQLRWHHWNGSKQLRCTFCYENNRISVLTEEVRKLFSEHGYTLTSDVTNKTKPVKIVCPKGHQRTIIPSNFIRLGERCGECAGNQRTPDSVIRERIEDSKYKFISSQSRAGKTRVLLECDKGHVYEVDFYTFSKGHRCGHEDCNGSHKYQQSEVEKVFQKEGYTLLEEYRAYNEKMLVRCKNGHEYHTSLAYWSAFSRCPVCGISSGERQIIKFLELHQIPFKLHDRSTINAELDFYFESKKLAVEYCGMYYHNHSFLLSRYKKKKAKRPHSSAKHHHMDKMNKCVGVGVKLITLFEETWEKRRTQVEWFLYNQLNPKVLSKDLEIRKVEWKQARDFLNDYHINGCGQPGNSYALIADDRIVQLQVFANNGGKTYLSRVCTGPGVKIIGGQSKALFQAGVKDLNLTKVTALVDRNLSDGGWYQRVGFQPVGVIPPKPIQFKKYWEVGRSRMVYDCGTLILKWPYLP